MVSLPMLRKKWPSCLRRDKGFSLIEAAIVLGLVGLVIGGIWTAASAVIARQRTEDVFRLIAAVHEKALALKQSAAAVSASNGGARNDMTRIMLRSPLPGGYTPTVVVGDTNNFMYNGQNTMRFSLIKAHYNGALGTYLYFSIYFKPVSTPDAPEEPNPRLRIDVFTRLLTLPLGTPPLYEGVSTAVADTDQPSTTWAYTGAEADSSLYLHTSGGVLRLWSPSQTKPTMTQIAADCQTALGVLGFWAL